MRAHTTASFSRGGGEGKPRGSCGATVLMDASNNYRAIRHKWRSGAVALNWTLIQHENFVPRFSRLRAFGASSAASAQLWGRGGGCAPVDQVSRSPPILMGDARGSDIDDGRRWYAATLSRSCLSRKEKCYLAARGWRPCVPQARCSREK